MTRVSRQKVSLLAALLLPLALLAGCGSDDGDDSATDPAAPTSATATPTESTPTESPSASETPRGRICDEVWVADAKLPGGYQSCYQDDRRIKANGRYCEFGKSLITYDGRFWAVPGGPIQEVSGKLLDDADYRDALASCSG